MNQILSISAALCGRGEDNCIWKGSSSGVYVKTTYNLGCNPVGSLVVGVHQGIDCLYIRVFFWILILDRLLTTYE